MARSLTDPELTGKAAARLSAEFGELGLDVTLASIEEVRYWAARSQKHLTRINVGRVTVAPPWDAAPPGCGLLVVIQPQSTLALGTIRRPACASSSCSGQGRPGRRVLDSLARARVCSRWRHGASARQASRRLITTRTPLSTRVRICRLNAVDSQVVVRLADLRTTAIEPADVVTANLTGGSSDIGSGLDTPAGEARRPVDSGRVRGGGIASDVMAAYVPPFRRRRRPHRKTNGMARGLDGQ